MNECLEQKKNLGLSRCSKIPQMPRCMITTGPNFKFEPADLVDASTFKAALEAAIVAGYADRVYLWPFFAGFENSSEAAIYEQSASGSIFIRGGFYRFRFMISQDLCVHTAMFTHRSTSGRVFIYDSEDNLLGTKDPDGNFYGFSYNLVNPENLVLSDGSVSTKSPVFVELANSNELNKNGAMYPASFVNTLERLTDVNLTVATAPAPSATKITVTVTSDCDGLGLDGLTKDDFVLKTVAGAAQTIASITALGNGVYELNGTGLVSGTVTLVSPATLSVKAYESLGPATVTIV